MEQSYYVCLFYDSGSNACRLCRFSVRDNADSLRLSKEKSFKFLMCT